MYKEDTTEELKCVICTIYPFPLCQSSSDSDVRASVTHSEDCISTSARLSIASHSSRHVPPLPPSPHPVPSANTEPISKAHCAK